MIQEVENDPILFRLIVDDEKLQDPIYKAGDRWKSNAIAIERAILRDGLQDFRGNPSISSAFGDSYRSSPFANISNKGMINKIFRRVYNTPLIDRNFVVPFERLVNKYISKMSMYRDLYYNEKYNAWWRKNSILMEGLQDNIGKPANYVVINEDKISHSYFDKLITLSIFREFYDFSKIESMAEIGGGIGVLTHLFNHVYPNIKRSIFVEVSPTIYIATQYLKALYGASPNYVIAYQESRDVAKIRFERQRREKEFLCLCPWQLEKVDETINLFIASATLEAMSRESINEYLNQILRLSRRSNGTIVCLRLLDLPQKSAIPVDDIVEIFSKHFSLQELPGDLDRVTNSVHYFVGRRN